MTSTPGTISPEALALLRAAQTAPRRDLSRPIADIRAETAAACAPLSAAAVDRWQVDVASHDISGLACQRIAPRSGASPGRALLYLFGGGFVQGSPDEDLPITAALAAMTGCEVIAPYYPLAPEHPWPAAANACTTLAGDLLSEMPNLCIAGESAGGNLALVVAQNLQAAGLRPPRALALMSPAADLADMGDSFAADRDPFLHAADTHAILDAYIQDRGSATRPGLSPLRGAFGAAFPPVLITTGTRDLLLSTCVRLDHVLRWSGAGSTLRVWEGMWHVFEYYPVPEADASLAEIAAFLTDRLAAPQDRAAQPAPEVFSSTSAAIDSA